MKNKSKLKKRQKKIIIASAIIFSVILLSAVTYFGVNEQLQGRFNVKTETSVKNNIRDVQNVKAVKQVDIEKNVPKNIDYTIDKNTIKNICLTYEEKILNQVSPFSVTVNSATGAIFISSGGLLRSIDQGQNWQDIGNNFLKIEKSIANPSIMYFTKFTVTPQGNLNQLVRSTDGGLSFDQYTPIALGENVYIDHILADRFDENKVYVFVFNQHTHGNEVYISSDKGTTFSTKKTIWTYTDNIYAAPFRRIWDVAQDPYDKETFFIVSEDSDHSAYTNNLNPHPEEGGSWETAKRYLLMVTNNTFTSTIPFPSHPLAWHAVDITTEKNGGKTNLYIVEENSTTRWFYNGQSGAWDAMEVNGSNWHEDMVIQPNNDKLKFMSSSWPYGYDYQNDENLKTCNYRPYGLAGIRVHKGGNIKNADNWELIFAKGFLVTDMDYDESTDTLYFVAITNEAFKSMYGTEVEAIPEDGAVYKIESVTSKVQNLR